MNKKQRIDGMVPQLQAWESHMNALDKRIDEFCEVVASTLDTPLFDAIFAMRDAYTQSVSAQLGDHHEWLDWYHQENKLGARAYEASPLSGVGRRKIRTARDLAWLIVESGMPRA